MSRASDRLREFHEAFGVPGEKTPNEVTRGRITLHEEEHVEVVDALTALAEVQALADPLGVKTPAHLMAVAEELADVMVIAYGTADVLGIDLDVAFRLKMDANMAKLPDCETCGGRGEYDVGNHPQYDGSPCVKCDGTGKGSPIKRADGKIERPEGWQKPSMAEAIK